MVFSWFNSRLCSVYKSYNTGREEESTSSNCHDLTMIVVMFNAHGYFGSCPPHGIHCYFFKLFALDQPLNLEPGQTKAEILQAIEGHVLASAELVGLYSRETET
jgi:Raf kinase inhibitor-like YbhB/YbcL family protein